MGIDENGEFGLAEHVDEAGGDDEAFGVDDAPGLSGFEVSDFGDAAILNGEIGGVPGGTGAVNDVAVADDDVVGRLSLCGTDEGQQAGELGECQA